MNENDKFLFKALLDEYGYEAFVEELINVCRERIKDYSSPSGSTVKSWQELYQQRVLMLQAAKDTMIAKSGMPDTTKWISSGAHPYCPVCGRESPWGKNCQYSHSIRDLTRFSYCQVCGQELELGGECVDHG